jgi:hypothetical protein
MHSIITCDIVARVSLGDREPRRFVDGANITNIKRFLMRDVVESLGRHLVSTPDAMAKLLRDLVRRAGMNDTMMMNVCVLMHV